MKNRLIKDNVPPLDEKGIPKHKFQVMMRFLGDDPLRDGVEKAVFIDDKKLDFSIDVLRFLEEKSRGSDHLICEQKRIEKQFVKSVSEAVGRKVTVEEIKRATAEGWI